ncbi:MAG: response regulator [Xanthomonadales bacterium]|nr:response regulator [Xanthomonadales bacterium]
MLLEDDPVSAAFLASALEALPARVDVAGSLAEARRRADGCDLWLFDAHLPDGDGASLLAELRACGLRTPALAHTAETRREPLDALIAAGFDAVLLKPLSVAALQAGVRRALGDPDGSTPAGMPPETPIEASLEPPLEAPLEPPARRIAGVGVGAKLPVWDDAVALRALNGSRAHVAAMRGLFLQELPTAAGCVIADARLGDVAAIRAQLHRLQASCGFVGAARMAAAVDALRARPGDGEALARFEAAVQDTLAASPALSDDIASSV